MCGIFGWQFQADGPTTAELAVLGTALAIGNQERGKDSWGVYIPGAGIAKNIGPITHGVHGADFGRHRTLLGHTRFRTTGDITQRNAHPFRVGHVVGMHNGCIWNHDELNRKYGRKFPVDSIHIFAHLLESRSLSELEGYGAIAWASVHGPDRFYLGRFATGELSILQTAHGVVYSSERRHLESAAKLAGLTGIIQEPERGAWFQVKDGLLRESGRTLTCKPVARWYRSERTRGWPDTPNVWHGELDDQGSFYASRSATVAQTVPTTKDAPYCRASRCMVRVVGGVYCREHDTPAARQGRAASKARRLRDAQAGDARAKAYRAAIVPGTDLDKLNNQGRLSDADILALAAAGAFDGPPPKPVTE